MSTPDSARADGGAYSALILRDGDTASAIGVVVAVPGEPVRLCVTLPDAVPLAPARRVSTPPRPCALGVTVTGVDLQRLTGRSVREGTVVGQASLTGIYYRGTLAVTSQSAPHTKLTPLNLDRPPCPPPAGGWPRGPQGENLDPAAEVGYDRGHPGAIVMAALLRPSTTQVLMYLLTNGEPAPVEAALHHVYGARLCVTKSRYSSAQVAAARAAVMRMFDDPAFKSAGTFAGAGLGLNPQEQVVTGASMVMVTDAVATLASTQPAGLIDLQPWLRPVRN